jgi:hypothetical protein
MPLSAHVRGSPVAALHEADNHFHASLGMRAALALCVGAIACGTPSNAAPAADAGPDGDPIYVSPAGSDAQSGCSPQAPKATIGAAIAASSASSTATHRVMVCHGTYDETVILAVSVSLLGGFDCAQFARTATYGSPLFDRTNEATIAPSGPGSALEVVGRLGADVVVDGFSFRGSPVDNAPAVSIHDGPTIVLSNDSIVGGSGSGWGIGSTGVDIRAAGPEITHDVIDGGAGKSSQQTHIYGSIGIYLEGLASIHDNRITGGTGTLGGDATGSFLQTASVGLTASGGNLTGTNAVTNNVIDAGHGTSLGKPGFGYEGVSMSTGSLELSFNTITAGDWPCTGFCAKTAVSVLQSNPVRLRGNRIYGGGAGNVLAQVSAVAINNAQSVEIVDNMIHSGNREGTLSESAGGVELAYVTDAFVAHNTVFLAPSKRGAAISSLPTSVAQHFAVENNLFLSTGQGTAFEIARCNGLAVMRNNAFSPFATVLRARGFAPCPGDIAPATVAATQSQLVADGADAQGNIEVRSTCATSACAVVAGCGAGGDQCAEALLDTFGSADLGLSGLFTGKWALAANPPCKVSQGGVDLTSRVPQDIFGAARTAPVSMGAAEQDTVCTP